MRNTYLSHCLKCIIVLRKPVHCGLLEPARVGLLSVIVHSRPNAYSLYLYFLAKNRSRIAKSIFWCVWKKMHVALKPDLRRRHLFLKTDQIMAGWRWTCKMNPAFSSGAEVLFSVQTGHASSINYVKHNTGFPAGGSIKYIYLTFPEWI